MNELQSLFDVALTDEPPLAGGPDRVFARADRLRNRHRMLAAATGLAGVLVVAGVAVPVGAAALGGGGGAGQTQGFGAPTVQSGSPSTQTGLPSAGGGATVPVTDGAAMLATLKSLVPVGLQTSQPFSQDGYAELVLTDSQGKGKLEINVQPHFFEHGKPGDAPPAALTCAAQHFPAGTTCVASTLPDGTLLLTAVGPNDDTRAPQLEQASVEIRRTDGLRIVVAQWNAVDTGHGPSTRPALLLTLDQLTAIATSSAWLG